MTILYKYFPLQNDGHFKRITRLLEGLIYFAPPIYFNDPFEMKPVYSLPTRNDLGAEIRKMGDVSSLLSRNEKKKIHRRVAAHLTSNPPITPSDDWLKGMGVLCLTTDPRNLLMWAHYASNHTGLCIGFDASHTPFSSARPINYSEKRPRVSLLERLRTERELVTSVLFSKSSHWEYESEYRCIKRTISEDERNFYRDLVANDSSRTDEIAHLLASEGGPGLHQFEANSIRRIYLGARIDPTKRETLAMRVHELGLRSKLFQLALDQDKYQLNESQYKYNPAHRTTKKT